MTRRSSHIGGVVVGLCIVSGTLVTSAESPRSAVSDQAVVIRERPVVIPTYEAGPPERNPIFYTQESYQGAQKRIYPYALQDQLTHARVEKTYTSLELENPYVAISVLPQLGGRLFSATDKTNQYDFFYRQHVIKPALIGMLGAWISGGVEWCAFHHHRNTTFMPVDYTLVENSDGSKTIWIGETERRHRMRWLIGLTLFPDKSYIEATVKFFNRTALPHSILYWANVAVHVNDQYQVLFPPSVQVATYHSKIDFTHWPISQGDYRGHDYRNADISWWKNSPDSNSFFAWNLREDFMGGYDHGRQAGVVHIGNHHVVCGAKLWEWGTGPYGRAWDEILTDTDGPYAELMVGAFSDNQPDYSWIKPYEVKTFKQYWYPIRDIGGFKNANLQGAVNLEVQSGKTVLIGFHTTSAHRAAKVQLVAGERRLCEETVDIAPDRPFRREVPLPPDVKPTDLRVSLCTAQGREIVAYQPVERSPVEKLPETVKPPAKPQEIKTTEELYFTGLRVEQIHNPTVDARQYYEEAIRRDPGDTRAHTMLGIHSNRRFLYAEAEQHLRTALARLTADYTRAQNGEAWLQLGIALRGQGKNDAAYDAFYRASWDQACHAAACLQLAELSAAKRLFVQALAEVNESLSTNALNTRALNLKASILRRLGRSQQAAEVVARVRALDPLDFRAMNEAWLLAAGSDSAGNSRQLAELTGKLRGDVQSYLELACDYAAGGMLQEAIDVLQRPVDAEIPFAGTYPLLHYLLGYFHTLQGDSAAAAQSFQRAAQSPPDYCFPFRAEERNALLCALQQNAADSRAHYYLGNLLYDVQPAAAIAAWEQSRARDASLATVHRNLGWAYYRQQNEVGKAIAAYEQALTCDALDPRLLLELDTLYEFGNVAPERRLAALAPHHAIVAGREDSLLREITVLVLNGKYDQAVELLDNNRFHAREGSEGIHDVFVDAHLLRGQQHLRAGRPKDALADFLKATQYPENLGVGQPKNDPRTAQLAYLAGTAHEALGQAAEARKSFESAIKAGSSDWPDARYYQGLAFHKLGDSEKAAATLDEVFQQGERRLKEDTSADFFAKFGEQETARTRTAAAHYLLGLGWLGRGDRAHAGQELAEAVKLNQGHVWARHWQTELGR
jgi:tetratricopeptide (TPR) repeat protein